MDNKGERSYGTLMICPECGKEFYCTNQGEWVYKRITDNKRATFCSWSCMRKHDKKEEEKVAAKREAGKKNHWRGHRITT